MFFLVVQTELGSKPTFTMPARTMTSLPVGRGTAGCDCLSRVLYPGDKDILYETLGLAVSDIDADEIDCEYAGGKLVDSS